MAQQKIRQHGSARNYHLKRRYGLTEQEVDALSRKHGDLCLVCLDRRAVAGRPRPRHRRHLDVLPWEPQGSSEYAFTAAG
jgi:hypothetical protein